MPRLSAWLIRAALFHLSVGYLLGAALLVHRRWPWLGLPGQLLLVHQELLVVGWTLQFVLAVAYWILPRRPGRQPRGSLGSGWVALAMLNGGVCLTALAHLRAWPIGALSGRVSSLAAVGLMAYLLWPRIRPASLPPAPGPTP